MPLGRPIIGLSITPEQRQELQAMARSRSLPAGLTLRAKIVLACAKGQGTPAVAADLGISAQTVCKWRERFRAGGLVALGDEVRTGRPRTIREERVAELLQKTLATKPEAVILRNTRRIRLLFSRAYPHQELFRHVCQRLSSA